MSIQHPNAIDKREKNNTSDDEIFLRSEPNNNLAIVSPTTLNESAYNAFPGDVCKVSCKKVVVQLLIKPSMPLSKNRKKLVNNNVGSLSNFIPDRKGNSCAYLGAGNGIRKI